MFVASKAPAASTGSSRVHRSVRPTISRELLIDLELRDHVAPRMVAARHATGWRVPGRWTWTGRHDAWRWHGRRHDGRPSHDVIAIPNFNLARGIFEYADGAASRRAMALPLELEQSIGVPHDPIIRDGACLFQAEDRIQ